MSAPQPQASSRVLFSVGDYEFCVAGSAMWHNIAKLNHKIFVQELSQHAAPGDTLSDKRHAHNNYITVVRSGGVVGMCALCDVRPFSTEGRLASASVLNGIDGLVEARLLSVLPEERASHALSGLLYAVLSECEKAGWKNMVISAIEYRLPMYKALTFTALGDPSFERGLSFTPMIASLAAMRDRFAKLMPTFERHIRFPASVAASAGGE